MAIWFQYIRIMDSVHLVECPRDAMQGWPHAISTADKLAYHKLLLQVGFQTIDIGSFVSHKAVPQMADTRKVLQDLAHEGLLNRPDGPRLLTIVANMRGAKDALHMPMVDDLGFPYSISESFQMRNAGTGLEEAHIRLKEIAERTDLGGKRLVVYLSMGFGNPYGDAWSPQLLVDTAGELIESLQLPVIALSDTVGSAKPKDIQEAFEALIPAFPNVEFGAHLHAQPWDAQTKIDAAYQGGCRRFDGAIRGVGGCPMSGSDLVGNMPTEQLISFLEEKKAWKIQDARAWSGAQAFAADLFQ